MLLLLLFRVHAVSETVGVALRVPHGVGGALLEMWTAGCVLWGGAADTLVCNALHEPAVHDATAGWHMSCKSSQQSLPMFPYDYCPLPA
jgi:hypothetical protein